MRAAPGLLAAVIALLALQGCMGVGVMGQPNAGAEEEGAWTDDAGVEAGAGDPDDDGDADAGDPGEPEEPEEDAGPVEEDAEPDADVSPPVEDAEPPCTYPTGPYELGVDQTVAPMRWPNAVALGETAGDADFESLFCNPEVHSVFIFVGNTL